MAEIMTSYHPIHRETENPIPPKVTSAETEGKDKNVPTKNEPCGDCISRAELLKHTHIEYDDDGVGRRMVYVEDIEDLPPVNPQEPKTGHWVVASDGYGDGAYICECSECKDTVWVYKDAERKWNYCPNCGAKMESEVK